MKPPSLESLWKERGFSPDDAQREAIRHVDGPLYLTAGPGSGKTRVLLWRTLNLIVFHGVPPEEIFLGTFTEKGAHQLREGIRGLLAMVTAGSGKPYDISKMAVGTIHHNCHSVLLDRRLVGNGRRPVVPVLLDAFDQYGFVYRRRNWERFVQAAGLGSDANRQINQYFGKPRSTSRHQAVVGVLSFFNRCSEESVDPRTKKSRGDPVLQGLLAMYGEYLAALAEDPSRPLTDLSLLQSHAFRRIAESEVGARLFRHIIVDEYQDTNRVQEKLYFRLAETSKNICVVGDDDQALYRFRGATVDNFLEFPASCLSLLGREARVIPLVTNYRSRRSIVAAYNRFMQQFSWTQGRTHYRVDKEIVAADKSRIPAVFSATPGKPPGVAEEVAKVIRRLIDEKCVGDPSDIAFLFPSLGSKAVREFWQALEAQNLEVYAPRAGNFLQTEEAQNVFGLLALVFGTPTPYHTEYRQWLEAIVDGAKVLVRGDKVLGSFIKARQDEIAEVVAADGALLRAAEAVGLTEESDGTSRALRDKLARAPVPERIRSFLRGRSLDAYIAHQRKRRPDRLVTVRYVINRACSLDWGVLDLFYQLTAFDVLKRAFDLGEHARDEGPICNLSLVSDYLARFQERTNPVITADFLRDGKYMQSLFGSYVYSIFRLGEGEYEDKEDPIPRGRIPFLTIHQAKGLEFSVVVLGNMRKTDWGPGKVEEAMHKMGIRKQEPLHLAPRYDIARMFYVALSRAKQALILCPFRGQGHRINPEFQPLLAEHAKPLGELRTRDVLPTESRGDETIPRAYSYTGDYLGFRICPRRYMMHRHYGFVPSRGQGTIFGNLVHGTIEDLHLWLMQQRAGGTAARGAQE